MANGTEPALRPAPSNRNRPRLIGIALGLVFGAALLAFWPQGSPEPTGGGRGPLLSECDGAIRSIALHYTRSAGFAVPVYRDLLRQLPADVAVHVLCPEQADFDSLTAELGPLAQRLHPVLVHHAMTPWSRDRWVAFAPADKLLPLTLMCPKGENASEIWADRSGDERVAFDLATALGQRAVAKRCDLYFDGGDLLADDQCVFVTPAVLRRNLGITVDSREQLVERLHTLLQRRIVLLDEAPDHHAGMFMMAIGQRTLLVGDAAMARQVSPDIGREDSDLPLPGGADFTPATQKTLDAVAQQAGQAGYRIVRIPVVPSPDGKTFLTWVNVLTDHREGKRMVYMPSYRGADSLNAAAQRIWEAEGYEVRPVDCTLAYRNFGCLHCLVNVLERD